MFWKDKLQKTIIQLGPFSTIETGGIIQSANEFGYYKNDKIENTILITTLGNSKLVTILRTYFLTVYYLSIYKNVMFVYHATARGLIVYFPLILFIRATFSPKIFIRKFAGDFDVQLSKNFTLNYIFKVLLRNTDRFFLETKFLVDYCNKYYKSKKIGFWPNTRNLKVHQNGLDRLNFQKKLIFLSRVNATKGIRALLEAMTTLKADHWTLEVYGPLEGIDEKELMVENVKYGGNLLSNLDVYKAIKSNNILVLPSLYPSEGYPGVIIEAMQLGVPVVVSNWRSLPELVGNGGVVLDDLKIESFQDCLRKLQTNYERYSKAAYCRGHNFNSQLVNDRVLREICSL